MRDLGRMLRPRNLAVIGGGAWCAQVIHQALAFGFDGAIHPVHPRAASVAGLPAVTDIAHLPEPPDAVFVGVNRNASIEVVRELSRLGAGGAVCFASGFSEAEAEDAAGRDLQAALIQAAAAMPILGPNCYGFINALDGALLWPDQHGCRRLDRGVAILTQSSNIAINLTMQRRAVPVAFVAACGNMAQTTQADIALALLDDPRITAIGLHIEGFGDLRGWERLAGRAAERGVPLVALKVGASDQARHATVSHTASLAGGDAGAQAFLDRLGIARLHDLPSFLETLKLLHATGRLTSNRIASISCSGGEASLIADMALGRDLVFPPLEPGQRKALSNALGPMVALANPLDYHTYIWRDTDAMTRAWTGMTGEGIGLTLSVVDYPHTDATDWLCATQAALGVRRETGAPFAVVSSLPELMPEDVAGELMAGGVVPMHGLSEALAAAEAAARPAAPPAAPVLLAPLATPDQTLTEAEAKAALAAHGLHVPTARTAADPAGVAAAAADLRPPLALKGLGLAHKSDSGAVRLMLDAEGAAEAARTMPGTGFLIEEMATGGVAELLVGVVRDPAHGFVLTLAAGGVHTEILQDSVSLLVPASHDMLRTALARLRIAPLLAGYRGRPGADIIALLAAVDAVQDYVTAHASAVAEVEVNPLICTPDDAIAVDALIRIASTPPEGDTA